MSKAVTIGASGIGGDLVFGKAGEGEAERPIGPHLAYAGDDTCPADSNSGPSRLWLLSEGARPQYQQLNKSHSVYAPDKTWEKVE